MLLYLYNSLQCQRARSSSSPDLHLISSYLLLMNLKPIHGKAGVFLQPTSSLRSPLILGALLHRLLLIILCQPKLVVGVAIAHCMVTSVVTG